MLWPPNHRLVPVDIQVTSADDSGAPPSISLLSVTSNEPDDGVGDGDTSGDVQGVSPGTADTHLLLRAERSGGGAGRVYTATYQAVDAKGNTTTASVQISVPHSKK